jgi:hypothetical protein
MCACCYEVGGFSGCLPVERGSVIGVPGDFRLDTNERLFTYCVGPLRCPSAVTPCCRALLGFLV